MGTVGVVRVVGVWVDSAVVWTVWVVVVHTFNPSTQEETEADRFLSLSWCTRASSRTTRAT